MIDTCSVMGSDATHHKRLPVLPNFSREGRGRGQGGKEKIKKSPTLWMAHNTPTLPNLYIQSSAPRSPLLPATQKVPTPTNQVPMKKKEFNFWKNGHPKKTKKQKNPNADSLPSEVSRSAVVAGTVTTPVSRIAAQRRATEQEAQPAAISSLSPLQ